MVLQCDFFILQYIIFVRIFTFFFLQIHFPHACSSSPMRTRKRVSNRVLWLIIFCQAYRQKMYGPHFVWMLINSVNNNWWIPKKGEDIACSDLEMKCQIQNHFSFYHTRIIASKKRFYSYANKVTTDVK